MFFAAPATERPKYRRILQPLVLKQAGRTVRMVTMTDGVMTTAGLPAIRRLARNGPFDHADAKNEDQDRRNKTHAPVSI